MDSHDAFTENRNRLEAALMRAAMDLTGYMGAAGFHIHIPGTEPPLFLQMGELDQLRGYVEDASEG